MLLSSISLVAAMALTPTPLRAPTLSCSRSIPAVMLAKAQKFATFDDLETEVRAYLATLDDAALNDPQAPSPLAYLELQSAGRADLAEGCMSHGGYLAVSSKLGVRIQTRLPPPSAPVPTVPFGGTQLETKGVSLSATAKEDRMAADLERLASAAPAVKVATQPVATRAVDDRLTPLKVAGGSSEGGIAEATDGPLYGLGRYVRLNAAQRAESLLLLLLLAAGWGQTSGAVLDAGIQSACQLGFGALFVGHLLIASYGAFVAASAPEENPALWAAKLGVTGAAGFFELRTTLDQAE